MAIWNVQRCQKLYPVLFLQVEEKLHSSEIDYFVCNSVEKLLKIRFKCNVWFIFGPVEQTKRCENSDISKLKKYIFTHNIDQKKFQRTITTIIMIKVLLTLIICRCSREELYAS